MKKSIIQKITAVAFGLMFVSQSCTNVDEEVYSEILAEDFFKTEDEFIAAVGQAYSSFGGLGNHSNLWSISELASDELVITTKGGDWYDGGTLLQLHRHNWTSDNGFFNNAWGMLYGGVNTCNRLIYQLNLAAESDPSKKPLVDKFVPELRAIRALWYYWLLDSFGNVPLATDFLDAELKPNSPRATVYAFVESELLAVKDILPTTKDPSTYGRMTKWAALAILTKLYLNAQVYTGTQQWAKAATTANDLITNGPYALSLEYASNFSIANDKSTENIFVFPYDKVFAGGFNWPMMTLHYASRDVYRLTDQPWNGYATVEEFYNSYIDPVTNPGPQGNVWKDLAQTPSVGTTDKRLSNFVVGPQFNPDGTRATDPGYETPGRKDAEGNALPSDPDGAPLTFTPDINQLWPNSWRQGGARIGKYEYEIGGTANMSNDFVVFRLADIILSLAEARWRQNPADASALTLVNQIRTRAGVDPFITLDADKLLAERGREMFAEMTRRQDLIRFDRFDDAWWEKPVSTATYKLFPIPKAQLDANNKLTQNPGY
jgi:starch-binding outer membrane protein, SusD/RagB family